MTEWRLSPVGVLIPAEYQSRPFTWPRPVGWDKLPADIRAAWDAKWCKVAEQRQGVR